MTQSILTMDKIETKFGNATLNHRGYYQITSRKEGNNLKYLHRLVWEDFYGKPIPKGYNIHHLNGDKTDNRIQNLQCVEIVKHSSFHNKGEKNRWYGISRCGEDSPMFGKHHSEESRKRIGDAHKGKTINHSTRLKLSDSSNTSGYLNVSKHTNQHYKQGFIWRYSYMDKNKRIEISRINLEDLEKEVKRRGLKWCKL